MPGISCTNRQPTAIPRWARADYRILSGFFQLIGDEMASRIVFVRSGMWEPCLKVIGKNYSEARTFRPFPYLGEDEVRRGESRRMARESYAPVLKKSRWLPLKREENLKTGQRFRLRGPLGHNLKTVRASFLKKPSSNAGSSL